MVKYNTIYVKPFKHLFVTVSKLAPRDTKHSPCPLL